MIIDNNLTNNCQDSRFISTKSANKNFSKDNLNPLRYEDEISSRFQKNNSEKNQKTTSIDFQDVNENSKSIKPILLKYLNIEVLKSNILTKGLILKINP